MTIDRNALASDLESLGLKAIAGSVRKGTVSVERALAAVKRARETSRFVDNKAKSELAQEILERYRGVGE